MNNDRFRFRAWNPKTKTMHEVRQIDWDNHDSYEICLSCDSKYYGRDELILLQCTGLKDSDGSLIWEGDLVYVTSNNGNVTGQVKYEEDGFVLDYYNEYIGGSIMPGLSTWEESNRKVIGNIYENPEFLKRNNDRG